MSINNLFLLFVCCCLIPIASRAQGFEPEWPQSELSQARARHNDWLVIDPPGGSSSYMKQSYVDPDKMELTVILDGPILVCGSFYKNMAGRAEVTYWFDDQKKIYGLQQENISNCITFSDDVLPFFMSAYFLGLRVELPDKGRKVLDQEFSLLGFAAAYRSMRLDE